MTTEAKPLTDSQLNTLKYYGYTKKELKSLATMKCKNFYLKNDENPEGLLRVNEDGTVSEGIS